MADPNSPAAEVIHDRRFTLLQRIQLTVVSWIVPALLRLIGCTLRATMTFEEGAIQSLDEIYPGIFPLLASLCIAGDLALSAAASGGDDQPEPAMGNSSRA